MLPQLTTSKVSRVWAYNPYSVGGGKSGLLRTLMDIWRAAPVVDATLNSIHELEDAGAILKLMARGVRSLREEFGDIIHVMLDAAPHDQTVAENLAIATARYRKSFILITERLVTLHALRPELTFEEAVDVLWFYFGYWGYFTLHNENKWTYEKAEQWLVEAAMQALLMDPSSST